MKPHATQDQGQATPEGATKCTACGSTYFDKGEKYNICLDCGRVNDAGESQSNDVESPTGYIGHTLGPWEKGTPGRGRFCVYAPKSHGRGICVMSNTQTVRADELAKYGDHPLNLEADANARLIAAAPDLLEALKSVLQALNDHGVRVKVEPDVFDTYIFGAERAIAKAEGKQ